MAGIAREDVEILVHVAAPSRGTDDARYRALAEAYLDFRPIKPRKVWPENTGDIAETSVAVENISSQLREEGHETQEERESAASYRPEDEDDNISTVSRDSFQLPVSDRLGPPGFLYSPQLSFQSVIDNANSPIFRRPAKSAIDDSPDLPQLQSQVVDSQVSWQYPSSVIADSQPDNQPSLVAFSSPASVLERYLKNLEHKEEPGRLETSIQEGKEGCLQIANTDSSSQQKKQSSSNDTTMEAAPSPLANRNPKPQPKRILRSRSPNAPSTQDPNAGLKRKWAGCTAEDAHAHTPSSAPIRIVLPVLAQSKPFGPQKRQQTVQPESTVENDNLALSNSTPITTSIAGSTIPSVWSDLLEVRPSPPATSTDHLTPELLITPGLHKLAQNLPPEIHFRPEKQIRGIRPMERGYWLIHCQTWDDKLRIRAWNYLGEFIGKDLAGWGVWCTRNIDHSNIRIYCWGIIVPNIYLLLYIASEGKIRRTTCCWIGGDRKTIVEMGK